MRLTPEAEREDPEFWAWVTAHHEAAHAVAYCQQDVPFRYVTLRPRRGDVAGRVALRRERVIRSSSASLIAAAGPVAEAKCCFASLPDTALEDAFTVAAQAPDGSDTSLFATSTPPALRLAIWRAHEQFVTGPLWPAVEAVAAALLGSPRALAFTQVRGIVLRHLA